MKNKTRKKYIPTGFNFFGSGKKITRVVSIFIVTLVWLAFGTSLMPNNSAVSKAESILAGLLDTTFGTGGIVTTDFTTATNDRAQSVALQSDGKIIAVGIGSGANRGWRIGRYNADGSLDTSFDGDGKLDFPIGGYASEVLIQPDGKIVVAGSSNAMPDGTNGFTVIRLNSNGTLDTTFDGDGIAAAAFNANYTHAGNVALLQPDGKIIVAGHYINGANQSNIEDYAAMRFEANGALDLTFGTNGKVAVSISNSDEASGAALQPDGKILIAGYTDGNGSGSNLGIVRLNTDGTLDATFDGDGKRISPFLGSFASDAIVQTDGRIVVAGTRISGNVGDFTAERYNTDGSLDTTFGSGGRVLTAVSQQSDGAFDIAFQSDGKFILSGYAVINSVRQFALARYNADGSLDGTFSTDGIETTQIGQISSIAQSVIQPDGKIVVAGDARVNTSLDDEFAIARYNSSGAGDPTPTPTITPTPTPTITPTPTVTPTITPTPTPRPSGTLDPTFDGDGRATVNFDVDNNFGSTDLINAVALQTDGKIVAAGKSTRNISGGLERFALARYNVDGSLDTTFNNSGKLTTEVGVNHAEARAVAVQPDGKIVIAGNVRTPTFEFMFAVVRYNADGSLDTVFGSNGIVLTNLSTLSALMRSEGLNAMQIQPDGKIVVAGAARNSSTANSDFVIVRYNSNGTLDTGFGSNGIVLTDFSTASGVSLADRASAVALQSDGKIVAAGVDGLNGTEFALARYNPNGSLDTTFGTSGKVTRNLSSNSDEAFAVTIQRDGKIVAAGRAVSGTNQEDFAVVRFNSNGTPDTTFNGNGSVITSIGAVDAANAVISQPDGKIIAVGTAFLSSSKFALVRYNTNGTLDSSFGTNGVTTTGFGTLDEGRAFAAALGNDGKVIAAGSTFTGVGITGTDFAIARYSAFTALRPTVYDFDGDGKSDNVVFRLSNSVWYLNNSANGFSAVQFGLASDIPASADFDGDGKTDVAVYRPSNGTWYLNRSTQGFTGVQFGTNGDLPVAADFDGDGKADISVFRPSNGVWYRLNSSNGQFAAVQFGKDGDKPIPQDFDGDGKADIAVYRPSNGTWYLNRSTQGFTGVQFGAAEDKPTAADFDGDGKADISVYRPSNGVWYRINSSNGQVFIYQFGISTDFPTVGDFDGDGKADISVFRASNGIWYRLNSSNGQIAGVQFGTNGDIPVHSIFAR